MYKADALHPNKTLEQKLQDLYLLHKYRSIDLSFRKPYLDLLAAFGDPHLRLPPVIHVAGTNGKGSVIAFMRGILEAAGYRVHVYTSPHLVKFNERIVLAGQPIGDGPLEALLDEAVALNNGGEVTFFEVTTAMAFAAFARTPADILLLEVGLGGRLDCTNVVPHPAATVITPISYDHMEFLGDSLQSIAAEKAGIMKPGAPCIVAPQVHETVVETLRRIAAGKGVSIICAGADWRIADEAGGSHILESGADRIAFPAPGLSGKHQISNAGTAIRVLNVLNGFAIPEDAIAAGVRRAAWPGRMQRLTQIGNKPVPVDTEVWIDGAHNEGAAAVLAHHMAGWAAADGKTLHLVTAMLNKRPPEIFLQPLLPHIASLTASTIPGEALSLAPAAIRDSAIDLGYDSTRIRCVDDPLEAVRALCGQGGRRVLVAGSLYLAGYFLRQG
jgi:dihydrofolate synthase/folylpolyglutamate synthase